VADPELLEGGRVRLGVVPDVGEQRLPQQPGATHQVPELGVEARARAALSEHPAHEDQLAITGLVARHLLDAAQHLERHHPAHTAAVDAQQATGHARQFESPRPS